MSLLLALAMLAPPTCPVPAALPPEAPRAARVQVYAHRGASALRPEHTLAAYARAIADGADAIEPDLVMTRDGVLVARHENEIGGTTDIAAHPEFAARRTTKVIDGQAVSGWFSEDFTLAELKTLRARERLPELRGTAWDGQFQVPTLEEIIAFTAAEASARGRTIGLVPELKHSTYFRTHGLPMEDTLLAVLQAHPYTRRAPVEIQSFEIGNLRALRQMLGRTHPNIRLLQLIDAPELHPGDVLAAAGTLTYAQMLAPDGLRTIAGYADAIGPDYRAVIPFDAAGCLGAPTALVRDAHAAGLEVHVYTFRPENTFLARQFRAGDNPKAIPADGMVRQIRHYLRTGIDAFFTDDPARGRRAVDAGPIHATDR
ncbi:MAG: glycerophosphodiester phosphodiesterase [Thermomonas haemolytica]